MARKRIRLMSDRFATDLMRGSLDMMVLSLLAQESHYGYSLQKQLNLATGGRIKLAAGTLYPLLHRLEAKRWIRSRWDNSTGRRRKWYDLTAAGRKRLATEASQWQQYADCVTRLLAPLANDGNPRLQTDRS